MRTLLTIAGFDPSSGAGITADLAVFRTHGYYGTSCITGLTVQSTIGVQSSETVSSNGVAETLACLEEDLPASGIKIGMLAHDETVQMVTEYLRGVRRGGQAGRRPVVLDPVVRSSSGHALLSPAGVEAMRRELLPLVDWVTPNLGELGVMLGAEMGVARRAEIEERAKRLRDLYPSLGVVVTGGHLPDGRVDDLVLEPEGRVVWLEGRRIESRSTHGTGCAFSSALLCGLVDGMDGATAARAAKEFVADAIRRAPGLGKGNGPLALW